MKQKELTEKLNIYGDVKLSVPMIYTKIFIN